jgi:cytoskeletal protein CcmA (bactofilin family)
MVKRGAAPLKPGDFTTLIDEGSEIEGKFSFSGSVMVNGRLRGEIIANELLVVGEKGTVNATIRAGFIQISGEVVGDVFANDRIELAGSSRVYGDVEAPVVIIDEGAVFKGHCRMTKSRGAEPPLPSARDMSVVPLKRSEPPR